MNWKKWPYWVKGMTVSLVICFLTGNILGLGLLHRLEPQQNLEPGFRFIIFPPLTEYHYEGWIDLGSSYETPSAWGWLILIIFYAVIGAIIGWLYGKIKGKVKT